MLILPFDCDVISGAEEDESLRAIPWANFGLITMVSILSIGAFLGNFINDSLAFIIFIPFGWLAHLNLYHLTGNLLLLFAFGNFANRRMGWWRYLLFAAGSGIGGAVAHTIFSELPVVGSSAVVFAALGFALVVAPGMPVRCTYWLLIQWGEARIPLFAVFGIILIGQCGLIWLLPDNPISHAAHGFGLFWGLFVGGMARRRSARAEPASR